MAPVSMQAPVCLIDNGTDGRMSVQQGALKILEQIQEPVVVVAVVGLYRTGKSYLMNRLAGKQTGFALGSTIESKTKGIWMWCVPHPSKPGHTLVLLDTEGLGDVEKGDEKHDTWIFCLAVLLSSTLVYNSLGTINNDALEKLHYVTELTEHIKVKSSEHDKTTELMRVFPSFVWTVRDFTLELELEGKPITADEYLENALKLKSGSSSEILRHNGVRQGLKDFFAPRRCFTFDRPANAKNMRRMEELTDADLDESFVEEARKFCSYIFNNSKPKAMRGGLGVTGTMLGSLAVTYVEAIRSGKVPCLDSAVESLAMIQNSRAITEALELYRKEMERWVRLPSKTQEALSEIHAAAEKQAVDIFVRGSFNDHEHKHQLELMRSVLKEYEEWCGRNVEESRRVCRAVISRVFSPLEEAVMGGAFMKPGGYKDYQTALAKAIRLYRKEKGKGLLREEVLTEYLKDKSAVGQIILAADRSLTETQQRMEALSTNGKDVIVDFPEQSHWKGLLSEMELVPSVHPRVRCDGCWMKPIIGPRFKCRVCDDFDFCENCFRTRKHNGRHSFDRINEPGSPPQTSASPIKIGDMVRVKPSVTTPEYGWGSVTHRSVGVVKPEMEQATSVHPGIGCDGCQMEPIIGPRFKCRVCDDFDFCETCFRTRKHNGRHSFDRINEPAEMEQATSVHPGIGCDGCQMEPIIGPRFKCRVCDDFDFCENCFRTRKHNGRHSFDRINEPGAVFISP